LPIAHCQLLFSQRQRRGIVLAQSVQVCRALRTAYLLKAGLRKKALTTLRRRACPEAQERARLNNDGYALITAQNAAAAAGRKQAEW